ncbi:MAG: efflux RND transporter periplasmic adaptor subunit [Fimbriimonadaceae bacterium]|nr:efflux RND transporter periplasmic adaptor subunit [Fimbriimonadaceae bacterium]
MKTLLLFLTFALAVVVGAVPTTAGSYRLDVVTDPATIPVGRANLVVTVRDARGAPVEKAEVRAIARMPGMNMGEREQPAKTGDRPGRYVVPAVFSMPGLYEITVTVNGASGTVELRTGQNTVAGGSSLLPQAATFGTAIALVLFVLYRIRKTGQRFEPGAVFNFRVLGSLFVLAGALAVAIWAVNNLRRPGAMTPIESQAMEMNTPAPEGTRRLRLATAVRRPFEASVSYTGQAVGYIEQNVVARVPGTIQAMTVYVGDRVAKGQALVRLDTSQLDPEVAMKRAGVGRAQEGVGVAALEYEAALDEVRQARAEASMAQGELDESKAMARAFEQGKAQADADIRAAEAEVAAREAEQAAAEADRDYARAELERAHALFGKGAVSRDELQRAKADADKADAVVRGAGENVRKARAMVVSARAMRTRVEAEAAAAIQKVAQLTAGIRAKDAAIRRAQSGADAAKARIGQERAMVREASAALQGAAAQQGYALIAAEFDGLVTERVLAPGQLVAPGQTILKIAQTDPIRLQANVPEADLARIGVGASVRYSVRGKDGPARVARVASVSPSVDPATRTGTVEVVVPNADGAVKPGQFVSMDLVVGAQSSAIVVPTEAIVRESVTDIGVVATGERALVWLAVPTLNGEFEVRRQVVTLGLRGKDAIVVADGVSPGDRVVLSPPPDLREGHRVVSADLPAASTETTITVTERGYEPATVTIPANRPATLTFVRKADPSCGDTLFFAELKIEKKLPLNVPVRVEIPAHPPGEIKFACGMDMYRGKVVVR